jgi:hypothetical protein
MSTKPTKLRTGYAALALVLIAQPAAAMHAHRHPHPVWQWQGANAAVSQPSNLSRYAYGAVSAPAGR